MNALANIRGKIGSQVPSAAGLVVLDGLRKPVYYNPEAIAVLSYPQRFKNLDKIANCLPKEVHSWLLRHRPSDAGTFETEFMSGRRHYMCRAFTLVHSDVRRSLPAITALLLERTAAKSLHISAIAEHFHLTQREGETVSLLTLGLTSKEIASRMNISPNTVKAFFRLVMTKMAVSTRSGIVGKIARM